jgi:UDP-N-acetylglucosamine 4-epimerase
MFIKKILSNESPVINGDGSTSRDFTYVSNNVDANIKACLSSDDSCGSSYRSSNFFL